MMAEHEVEGCGRVHNHRVDELGGPCGAGGKVLAITRDKASTKSRVDSALPGEGGTLGGYHHICEPPQKAMVCFYYK